MNDEIKRIKRKFKPSPQDKENGLDTPHCIFKPLRKTMIIHIISKKIQKLEVNIDDPTFSYETLDIKRLINNLVDLITKYCQEYKLNRPKLFIIINYLNLKIKKLKKYIIRAIYINLIIKF